MAPKQDPPSRGNPFAALEALRSVVPASAPRPEPIAPGRPKPPARAVVRMERKGRGGKEVTIVEKLGLPQTELEAWCRELKQALGCGGSVNDDMIILQGDLRPRVAAVLTAKGVEKVAVG
jgi:translation initiation factor 1